jgi:hypothetical protein
LAAIRDANRHIDWVVWMRLGTVGALLALSIADLGLDPLRFVGLVATLFVAAVTIELTRAPPAPVPRPQGGPT